MDRMDEHVLDTQFVEKSPPKRNGIVFLIFNCLLVVVGVVTMCFGIAGIDRDGATFQNVFLTVIGLIAAFVIAPVLFVGLKTLKRNEALVLTLFGKYYGTLKGEGYFFVNPFVVALNPASFTSTTGSYQSEDLVTDPSKANMKQLPRYTKKISLKTMTLNNNKQKINDQLGNPIVIGIVVIWRVVNAAKAVYNVDNYTEYLSIQCDSALRNIVRLYPYDLSGGEDVSERSLRGSSQEVSERIKEEIQEKVNIAGLEIMEARITHLAYAPEIAAAMLQRQQASAIIDARQMIVDGAVGMVEMALDKLSQNNVVNLDEERKAAMVSNLLVVLCGNRDAQPIVNSGSLY